MAFFDGFLDKAGSFLGDFANGMDAGFNGGKIPLSDGQTSPSTGGYLGALLAGFDPMIQQNAIQSHANKIYAGGNQQAGDNYVQQENQAQALINDRMNRIYERRKLEDKTRALRSFAKNINGGNDPVVNMLKQYADLNPEAGASALATYVMQNQNPDAVLKRQNDAFDRNYLSGNTPASNGPTAAPAVLAPTADPMEALRSIDGDVMSTFGTSSAPSQAPISVRNNNPGNMRGQDGQFAMYDSPDAGMAAMNNDLGLKIGGRSPIMQERFGPNYTPTLSNVISTWAPPSENDTGAYIQSVAQQTGIDPNRPLSEGDLAAIVPAMVRQEGGASAAQYYSAPQGQTAPAAPQTSPAYEPGSALKSLKQADEMEGAGQRYVDLGRMRNNPSYIKTGLDLMDQASDLRKEANPDPQSTIAKLGRDYKNGLITKDQYDQAVAKEQFDPNLAKVEGMSIIPGSVPTKEDAKAAKDVAEAYSNIKPLLEKRRELIDKYGAPVEGTQAAQSLDQNANTIMLQIKNLEQSGALDKGTVDVIRPIIGDPVRRGVSVTSPLTGIIQSTSKTKDFNLDQLKNAQDYIDGKLTSVAKSRGYKIEVQKNIDEKKGASENVIQDLTNKYGLIK